MHDSLPMLTRFAIASLAVLLLPRLLERFRLPGVLGFILAGIILGPTISGMLDPEGPTIELFAELGKLLFMFFVGFEVNLDEFAKARNRAALFGLLTFALPFAGGLALGLVSGYSWVASLLIGSIIASHTLLAFPLVSKLNLVDRNSVLVTVGATIFTDVAAMIILALAVSIHQTGFSWQFLIVELVELAIFVPLVLFGLAKVARMMLVRLGDSPESRVTILLVLIATTAQIASLINLEGIVGAFLAGIAVKRAVRGKFAVEQLEIVARALFIPSFFLATGFLVDFALLGKTIISRPGVVFGILSALLIGKGLAAWLIGRLCKYSRSEQGLIFSLTIPQMAATLASAVVGYQTLNAQKERLLDAEFVNATLVLVVATCVLGPILSERFAKRMVAEEKEQPQPTEPTAVTTSAA